MATKSLPPRPRPMPEEAGPLLSRPVVMVGGKGGVGKTTCCSALAMECARRGERVLLLSTDPTPSLADILEVPRNPGQVIRIMDNLHVLEFHQEQLVRMWDRKFGREVYEVFSALVEIDYAEFVKFLSSVLPGLAEEFMLDHVREMWLEGSYRRIIWDTAPMGQTLGLLRTPAMLKEHLRPAPRIYSRLRLGESSRRPILDTISRWATLSQQDLKFLAEEVEILLVAIPEALSVEQLARIEGELAHYGLEVKALIVNQVALDTSSEFMRIRAGQQRLYLELLAREHPESQRLRIPLFPTEIRGTEALEKVRSALFPA